ncbi:MBL fold metallo-hydrolase [Streptomyces sp. NPDC047049]|uniref:MBL fold metallo-hydrolase n=1 Tax=Streptomyces sp. NPDC047049 TaxID=3156688 RepID=UPI0033FFD48F
MTDPSGDSVTLRFIGNATTLLSFGDLTLLTDPNFLHRGQYAYLGYGLVSRRLTEPVLNVDELPGLDAIVLSHLHGDHWDRTARRHLDKSLPVITTPHASRRLHGLHRFSRTVGLRTWQDHTLVSKDTQVRITALPGRHAKGALRFLLPPVMGSLLEFGPAGGPVRFRLYITGDTLLYDGLAEICSRYPHLDLTVLHLGGTLLPGGFMVTMDGAQGAELASRLPTSKAMPIHYDDYTAFSSPLEDFLAEARKHDVADRIVRCERGAALSVAPGETAAS